MKALNRIVHIHSKYWFVCAICALFVVTCSDILEEDISNLSLKVNSPKDSIVFNAGEVIFWWEPMTGASGYEIIVGSPSFDSLQTLILDSLLLETKIAANFSPGRYEWMVRGRNSGYESKYVKRFFQVK